MKLPFKLSLTDKFLLDLYDIIEKIDQAFDLFTPLTTQKIYYPDFYKLRQQYKREKAKSQFRHFVYSLKKKGYIKIKNLEGKQGVILTKKGAEKILKIKSKIKNKKKRPDGKWQMLIFDIPEQKRKLRNIFRDFLYTLGYQMLQKSVWVCPYDTLKETEGFIQRNYLEEYVKLFLIEEVEV